MAGTHDFTVLAICTANRCRSPLAEFSLRRATLALGLPWQVRSAGLRAVPGLPPHPHARTILTGHGDDLTGWTSSVLTSELVGEADLILTATREHRSELCSVWPALAMTSFPLLEFAAWCALLGPQDDSPETFGPRLLARIQRERAYLPKAPRDVDLDDPLGRPLRAFRRCDKIINRAVAAMVNPFRRARSA